MSKNHKNDPIVAKATAMRIRGQPKTDKTQRFRILKLQSILETVPTSHQILFRYENGKSSN